MKDESSQILKTEKNDESINKTPENASNVLNVGMLITAFHSTTVVMLRDVSQAIMGLLFSLLRKIPVNQWFIQTWQETH